MKLQQLLIPILLLMLCGKARSQSTNKSFSFSSSVESAPAKVLRKPVRLQVSNGQMVFTSKDERELHIYVFDEEGTMVWQAQLQESQKKSSATLPKGNYLYTVFAREEGIDEGKIVIK